MTYKKQIMIILFCLIYFVFYSGRTIDQPGLFKPLTNDHYNFIAVNEIKMWISNNGDGSHDPATDGNGFYWPGGIHARDAAIFEDGLLWGGIVDGQKRVNGNTHFQGLQTGKILSPGIADNPALPKYRVYKIKKDWVNHPVEEERSEYDRDYNEWPVKDGAPWIDVDGDGVFTRGIDQPEFVGDEVLWYVSNDLDLYRSRGTYGSDPIGLEFQTLVWGYKQKNILGDVVIKKYTVINKSTSFIDSMYFSYWTDDDLGDASDDFVGCDTLLNLGYTYNGDNEDGDGAGIQYGLNPPAVGHMFVQGPIVPGEPTDLAKFKNKWVNGYVNLNISAFVLHIGPNTTFKDPYARDYKGTLEVYNYMQGLVWNGNPFIDPHTGKEVKFTVPGDPVNGEGWYEGLGWPGGEDSDDRRFLMTSGPLTMAPGDTQEVVIAILMGQGEDHLDSVTELKKAAQSVQIAYDHDFKTTPVMDIPSIRSASQDKGVLLYWDLETEHFDATDPILNVQDVDDQTYTFEGYRVWQYRDIEGSDPRVLATYDYIPPYYDFENNVTIIYDWQLINGFYSYVPVIIGEDTGIRRSHLIKKSIYDDQPLNNGNPYYFAVTAYAYSEHSYPKVIESKPEIIEVIPGLHKIDQTSIYNKEDHLIADHISGVGDGDVELVIVDPNALTGDEYRVVFQGDDIFNAYSFINYTQNDTIIADCTDYGIDTVAAVIIDGFILKIYNEFEENHLKPGNYRESSFIKNVLEMTGPDGNYLDSPVDVFEHLNSSADWEITSYWEVPDESLIQNIDMADGAGFHNYEVRFTTGGSQYYLSGSARAFSPWRGRDPLASDRVPLEVWDVGSTDLPDDDVRLTIKILDDFNTNQEDSLLVKTDGTWSQLDNGNWEPVYAFFEDSVYSEPLVDPSAVISPASRFKVGKIVIRGNLPQEGTIIQISTVKPLSFGDVFSVIATAPNTKDYEAARTSLDDISVFPNPFFGTALYSGYNEQSFVRFTNLPTQVTLRIFSIGGTYIRRLDKNDQNPWLDWDLKNNAGETVASGVYIAHLEMPNIGEKVMKLAVILENVR